MAWCGVAAWGVLSRDVPRSWAAVSLTQKQLTCETTPRPSPTLLGNTRGRCPGNGYAQNGHCWER